ncbi:MAG: putative 2-aminoethylphosphonate transport system permease protein PhnV [Spirochaetes bacterium ADurb.Bin315]|mgnify:FL=1|jgi:iron(III) transport system permease protein|nr:MAG: putative 2-aminoethylphosphonate transport system permease protein PhnV [Spirochaetes bacterium ADurb.Bin315]HPB42072.1 iron ABC transporter permease [Sphaerochaeta sp.]HPY45670.1 iron ABC transporter permease [Sphaerochaeta sp.]HQB05517.1 iron ABC transporter permease [Sphaerochaeta sp.]
MSHDPVNAKKMRKDITPYLIFTIPLVFMMIFLMYPMVLTILRAFMPSGNKLQPGAFSLDGFTKFFTSSMYKKALNNSFIVSLSVTGLCILIGVPMGYFVARVKIPGKNFMLSLGILPIIMPSFVGAFTWVILLGRQGVVRHFLNLLLAPLGITIPTIYGMFGMILCMTLTYYPFVFQLAYGAFASANALLEEAGMLMGASRWHIFRTITFPLILPSLGAGALLVFVRAIGNFGIPAIIGGDKYVLPTLIYFRVNGFWDLNGAASIAIVNVAITALVLYLQKRIVSRHEYETISATHSEIKQHDGKAIRIIAFVYCAIILVVSLLPQITIIVMSFFEKWVGLFPEGFTLRHYTRIPTHSHKELFNTFYLSIMATVLAALLGSLVAYITERKKPKGAALLDMSIMMPFILPGTVVSVALLSAFSGNSIIKLTGTYTIIVISYMVRRTPYVYRSVAASLSQLNPSLEEASTIAGANWFYTFRRVSVPLIMPAIISGSILTLTTLLQELSTTILLYSSKTRTVPIQIYGAVADGKLGEASALSVVLLIVVFVIVYAMNRKQGKSIASAFKMG